MLYHCFFWQSHLGSWWKTKSIFLFNSWDIKFLNMATYSLNYVLVSLLLGNLFKKENLCSFYVGNVAIWHYSYSWRNLILRHKTDILLFSSLLPFQVSSYLAALWTALIWSLCYLIIYKVCGLNNFSLKYVVSDFKIPEHHLLVKFCMCNSLHFR